LSPTTCEAAAVGADPLDLLGGFDQRRDAGRRVGFVGILHGYTDAGACLEIDGMLGFVGEVRLAVLHLRDLRVGVVRMRPVVVRFLLLPLAIEACQVHASASRCPRPARA
jgi:hypothetical protein